MYFTKSQSKSSVISIGGEVCVMINSFSWTTFLWRSRCRILHSSWNFWTWPCVSFASKSPSRSIFTATSSPFHDSLYTFPKLPLPISFLRRNLGSIASTISSESFLALSSSLYAEAQDNLGMQPHASWSADSTSYPDPKANSGEIRLLIGDVINYSRSSRKRTPQKFEKVVA